MINANQLDRFCGRVFSALGATLSFCAQLITYWLVPLLTFSLVILAITYGWITFYKWLGVW